MEETKDLELIDDQDLEQEAGVSKKTIALLRGREYVPTLSEWLQARQLESLEADLREVGVA